MIFKDHQHCEDAHSYALQVVAGTIPAKITVVQSCQRYLDDLYNDDLGYSYDPDLASRACSFIERLVHTRGKWAKKAQKLKLDPWQKFIVCNIFGWINDEGLRRFRYVYVEVPRKNGKSLLASAIALYMLVADGEHGAEVYCGATNEKQALEVFTPAKQICQKLPGIVEKFGIEVNAKSLSVVDTGSKFQPIIGTPGDGPSPSCWIVDEYHEHANSDQYDTADTGMGARDQPILFVITTAGKDTAGPCYAKHREIEQLLAKTNTDERTFGIIYGLDDDDDWTKPEMLAKANPNFGISVSKEYLLDKQKRAQGSATDQNATLIKHFNRWVSSKSAWLNMTKWLKCADPTIKEEDFKDDQCVIALDLATKIDIAAKLKLYVRIVEGIRHYFAFCKYYIPDDQMLDPPHHAYYEWVAAGLITPTNGAEIDFSVIEEEIRQDMSTGSVREVTYDPWKATQLIQNLAKEGVPTVEFRQIVQTMSPAMKETEAAIESGRFHFNGCPVLTWMAGNVTAKADKKDNIYPNKEFRQNKIDGVVALIMAVGRAMYDLVIEESVYDRRDVRQL